jgi:hypothetical protein
MPSPKMGTLEAMTEQCNKVGEELIDALQRAKVQGAHKR